MGEHFSECENCFWWDCFACDGAKNIEEYNQCKRKMTPSTNDKYYHHYYNWYQDECDKAMEPVKERFEIIFKNFNQGCDIV